MNSFVFGITGRVATELRALSPGLTALGRDGANLSDPEACAAAILARRPAAVINAAAHTAVDRAEEEGLATSVAWYLTNEDWWHPLVDCGGVRERLEGKR